MGNLKLDTGETLKAFEAELQGIADDARRRIERAAADFSATAKTSAVIPPTLSPWVESAAVAWTKTHDFEQEATLYGVLIRTNMGDLHVGAMCDSSVPAGRYRAVFLLFPLADAPSRDKTP